MKKFLFTAVVAAAVIGTASCSQQKKGSNHNVESQSQFSVQKEDMDSAIFGTYKGTFPCADCGGKDIALTISEDSTYCLKYQYQDRNEGQIEENGTYYILNDSIIVTVTPSSGYKTYYKYIDGNMELSDSLGTSNQGELAKFYVLKK